MPTRSSPFSSPGPARRAPAAPGRGAPRSKANGAARPRANGAARTKANGAASPKTNGAARPETRLVVGDCMEVLPRLSAASADLVVTSPPYADQRRSTYGGIAPDDYVEWFMPAAEELRRVLKPEGSFVLNIKERVVAGERHPYVLELILAMRRAGWLWTEEYVWHKRNCHPGKWPNRFRDAWERCLHFTLSRRFEMHQEEVMVPMGEWRHARLRSLSATDRKRDESRVGSGFGKRIENWVGRDRAYPTNVLHLATECSNRGHSAAFPEALPDWFIRLFTSPGGLVLDPFCGSGTTLRAASRLGRRSLGIEVSPEYCEAAAAEMGLARRRAPGGGVEFRDARAGRPAAPTEELKERFCLPDGSIDWDGRVRRVSAPPGAPSAPGA